MRPATASRSWAFMATTSRSIASVIRSSPGSQALAPARTAIVRAVAHESQSLKAAALAYASRPGAAQGRTRTHRDKGNDADFNMHDKSSCLGTVRSSCRSGRRSAVRLRTDHSVRHGVGRPPQRLGCRPVRRECAPVGRREPGYGARWKRPGYEWSAGDARRRPGDPQPWSIGPPLVLAPARSVQRREPCGEVTQLPGLGHDAHAG
jgi:hypothetical protein